MVFDPALSTLSDGQVALKLAELAVAHPFPGEGSQAHFTLEEFPQLEKLGTLGEVGFLQSQALERRGGTVTSWLAFHWSCSLLTGLQHLPGLTWILWWVPAI